MSELEFYASQLKEAGLAQNEAEVSALMGKSPSYISSKKAKGKDASTEALTHLLIVLEQEMERFEDGLRYGVDLSDHRLMTAAIIYNLKKSVWNNLKIRCGGAS